MPKLTETLSQLSENTSMINPPRGKLLGVFAGLMTVLFFILVITVNIFVVFSIPMLFFWSFFYRYYVKIWSAFGYSKLMLFFLTALVASLGIIFGDDVRTLTYRILQSII